MHSTLVSLTPRHLVAGADLNWSSDAYSTLLPLLEDPELTKVYSRNATQPELTA